MQILFQQFTQIGKRTNNEDYILSSNSNGIFIVCDGVGGNNKGEIASELCCKTILSYFSDKQSLITSDEIDNAIKFLEKKFSKHIIVNPESKGMATTLAFLQLNNGSALVSHVGDSRIYQIRNGKIIFQTKDHSLVNELVASGFITLEEAKSHPKKNIITRAIQGDEQPTLADTDILDDLYKNDYFFMCTDGILEGIDEKFIEQFFTDENDVNSIMNRIKLMCYEKSNDNNSAILIKILVPKF